MVLEILELAIIQEIQNLQAASKSEDELQEQLYEFLGVRIQGGPHEDKKEMPFKFIEAIITYDCNLSCSYCWQRDSKFDRHMVLEKHIFQKVLDLIQDYNQTLSYTGEYRIGYMGGEPLLQSNLIFDTFDMAKNQLIQVKGGILTNGIQLTDTCCVELKKRNIDVCVSVDGPPHINYRRKSFDRSWEGIQVALSHGIKISIQSTLSTEQIKEGHMDQVASFFLGNNLPDFNILLESPLGDISEEELYLFYKSFLDKLVVWSIKENRLPLMLKNFIYQVMNKKVELYSCFCRFLYPAGLQIDPSGNIFACEFDREQYSYGNINNKNISFEAIQQKTSSISKYKNEVCRLCNFIGICYGYPRLCSLYKNEPFCHMKAYYRACFDVVVDELEKLSDILTMRGN